MLLRFKIMDKKIRCRRITTRRKGEEKNGLAEKKKKFDHLCEYQFWEGSFNSEMFLVFKIQFDKMG